MKAEDVKIKPLKWIEPKGMKRHASIYGGFYITTGSRATFCGYDDIKIIPEFGESPEQACERHHRESVLLLLDLEQ